MNAYKFSRPLESLAQTGAYRMCHRCKTTCNQNVNNFTERSHTCGQLTRQDVGRTVSLYGWVKYTRFDNKIISLRDSYGTIQCIVDKSQLTKSFRKTPIYNESVLKVTGMVRERPDEQKNESQALGNIEVLANRVDLISLARRDLPILTRESDQSQTIPNRLKYRYLDIRSESLQQAIRFRSKIYQILRQSLLDLCFVECETPTLFRRTPGGANEFIVPTQMAGSFYGLTQSPQQLKQLLMIGGLDRYFQICRCYRDEVTRSDRQPEFTQLDIELAFTSKEHVMGLIDQLIVDLFRKLNQDSDVTHIFPDMFNEKLMIDRITYEEAFRVYGTDKPDTRFDWFLEDVFDGKICLTIPQSVDAKIVTQCLDELSTDWQLDISKCKLSIESSGTDTKIIMREQSDLARMILGELRVKIAMQLQSLGREIYRSKFKFTWVTDFPLFTKKNGLDEFEPNHHPFTAPTDDTAHYLSTDPSKVIGQHYDLVLNGQEIGGGSMRIHKSDLQKFIFNDILKLDDKNFDYFTQALSSGCPPHGGLAIGLDRFIAILLGKDSIREVIAFPKSTSGRDLMSGCPHQIDLDTQKMYHISTTECNKKSQV